MMVTASTWVNLSTKGGTKAIQSRSQRGLVDRRVVPPSDEVTRLGRPVTTKRRFTMISLLFVSRTGEGVKKDRNGGTAD
jgi:hypothetical protein